MASQIDVVERTIAPFTELVADIGAAKLGEFATEHGFIDFKGLESVRFSQRRFRLGVRSRRFP